jgi:tRNA:m4X modification enzyme
MSEDDWPKCKFRIKEKNRLCKQQRQRGSEYCIHHSGNTDDVSVAICPFCSTKLHEKALHKHIGKCPAKLRMDALKQQPFYVENCNIGEEENDVVIEEFNASAISAADFERILRILEENYIANKPTLKESVSFKVQATEDDAKEFQEPQGHTSAKHFAQQTAIISHVVDEILEIPNGCFVEMGAGKAYLSKFVLEHVSKKVSVLAIDYGSFKGKADTEMRKIEIDGELHRFSVDLKDVCLEKVSALTNQDDNTFKPSVACAKHLCGCGSDFAVRSLKKYHDASRAESLRAVAIATCCHGVCNWKAFVGKEFIRKAGLSKIDFSWIVHMSAWATTFFGKETNDKGAGSHPLEQLSTAEKRCIGLMCKCILDCGRKDYIQKEFSKASSVSYFSYVDASITPECQMLLVKFQPSSSSSSGEPVQKKPRIA